MSGPDYQEKLQDAWDAGFNFRQITPEIASDPALEARYNDGKRNRQMAANPKYDADDFP